MIILAFDALDLEMVTKFKCENLMQKEHGQTDLTEFPLKRTVALWASFLTGKNLDPQIPVKTQWEYRLTAEETFLKFFKAFSAIDVPAYSHVKIHDEERRLLKAYFNNETTVEEFDALVWKIHEENKKEFLASLGKFDLLMGYFNLADSIGHLSFGINEKMKDIYEELEGLSKEVRSSSEDFVLTISDHGMKALGRFGDHSDNGFYSVNKKLSLGFPKITDFYSLIRRSQNVT
jgi:3-hydroxyacyl-CoA dehydrogenase